jgi:very-short-patch-repair endonuclease
MKRLVTRVPLRADGSRITTECERRSHAKRMRSKPTPAERMMADRLSGSGVDWGAQKTLGTYIIDFVIRDRCAVIEVDGGYHDDEQQQWRDRHRDSVLREAGFRVFRVRNEDVSGWPMSRITNLPKCHTRDWVRACSRVHEQCQRELKLRGLHTSARERRHIRAHFSLPVDSTITQEQVLSYRDYRLNPGR